MNVRRSMLALVVAVGAVLIAASPAFADFGSGPDEPFVVLTRALVVPIASAVGGRARPHSEVGAEVPGSRSIVKAVFAGKANREGADASAV